MNGNAAVCTRCFASTRLFGVCVSCGGNPPPGSGVGSPVLRWFLDVLARRPEETLGDADVALIRRAARGEEHPDHTRRMASDVPPPESGPGGRALRGRYLGTEGSRLTVVDARCVLIRYVGSTDRFGDRYLVKFKTAGGSTLVWWTGEGGKFDPAVDGVYSFTASVKSHTPFDGEAQTVIQRPREIADDSDGEDHES